MEETPSAAARINLCAQELIAAEAIVGAASRKKTYTPLCRRN